jgi:hypothetical protein
MSWLTGEKKIKPPKEPLPPLKVWLPAVAVGWIVPGGGHFLLKRNLRGMILSGTVTLLFVLGLMMRGSLFSPQTGDLFTTVMNCGGWIGDLMAGVLYLLAVWMGYAQPDSAGLAHDYGTKFLVIAGILNVLAMVDAFEIAAGKKD